MQTLIPYFKRYISLALGLLLLALPATGFADDGGQHIAITPSSAALSIAPGGSLTDQMTVVNQGRDAFSVKTSVAPYHVEGIDYNPEFTQLPGTVDASKWVILSQPSATPLQPNALLHISYTIRVPANTQPGGYYAVLFAETTPVAAAGGVVAHNRVGEILYITVQGAVHTQGSVLPGKLAHLNTTGVIAASVLVRNEGGVHFQSNVTVSVRNIFGKTIFTQTDQRYVLPQTERQVIVSWSSHAPIGLYHIRRQATVPSGTVKLPDSLVFVIQPWVIVGLIIALLLVVTVLLRNHREHKKHAKE